MSASEESSADGANDEPLPELPFAKTRAAFLLGCYLQLPATDMAPAMLMEVCDALSPTRVLLLDQALVRLEDLDLATADGETAMRPSTARCQRRRAVERIRQLSDRLWGGDSELRDWYRAGVAVGHLLVTVFAASSPSVDALEPLIDAACAACRAAAGWSKPPQDTAGLRQFCRQLPQVFTQSHTVESEQTTPVEALDHHLACTTSPAVALSLDPEIRCLRLLDSAAVSIRDPGQRHSTVDEERKRQRDQFLYEAIAIWGLTGTDLIEEFNRRVSAQHWPSIGRPDKYRELATEFARCYELPPLPARPLGRPRSPE